MEKKRSNRSSSSGCACEKKKRFKKKRFEKKSARIARPLSPAAHVCPPPRKKKSKKCLVGEAVCIEVFAVLKLGGGGDFDDFTNQRHARALDDDTYIQYV